MFNHVVKKQPKKTSTEILLRNIQEIPSLFVQLRELAFGSRDLRHQLLFIVDYLAYVELDLIF